MKQISGKEIADFTSFKVKKLNKTARGIVGNIILHASDVDNTMMVEARLSQKQGGEYRRLPYKLPPKKLCDFFNEDVYVFPDVVKVSNVPSPLPCPPEPVRKFFTASNM